MQTNPAPHPTQLKKNQTNTSSIPGNFRRLQHSYCYFRIFGDICPYRYGHLRNLRYELEMTWPEITLLISRTLSHMQCKSAWNEETISCQAIPSMS